MKQSEFINRELSWLAFNERVLEEAQDPSVPLLDRVKFLAITGSNLDEFFMVRVGGLKLVHGEGRRKKDPAGMTPLQQLKAVNARARRMIDAQYECWAALQPLLEAAGVCRRTPSLLSDSQREYLDRYFEEVLFPVLTPMALDEEGVRPLLMTRQLYLLVRLEAESDDDAPPFSVIPLGEALGRLVTLPGEGEYHYMLLEEVVAAYAPRFFPGRRVAATIPFRMTRNADMSIQDDLAADLLSEMRDLLTERKRSGVVRLEVGQGVSQHSRAFLRRFLDVGAEDVFEIEGPVDISAMMELSRVGGYDELKAEPWGAQSLPEIDPTVSMFENIAAGPLLLFHPQQSFEPVVRFLQEAAVDPDVLAIKQVLYRTSKRSPIVAALAKAAENGKYVTALVELKARFDEARNIEWARALEMAGVQVIYGIKGLKTHAKALIVVRREADGLRRYVHYGTGNYNEVTAQLYTDISYMTSEPELGADASAFFNTIVNYTKPERYLRVVQSPGGIKAALIALIEGEAARCRQGQKARIIAKMNSLADPEVIDALYKASQAGVTIQLNVRGICCLKPGLKGVSETIEVISIVDRFLEHDRIFYFRHGGDDLTFISSADWMPRNLDRRIELMVPVEDKRSKRRLIELLKWRFKDTLKARRLLPAGDYERVAPRGRKGAVRSQAEIYRMALHLVRDAAREKPVAFEPHKSPRQAT